MYSNELKYYYNELGTFVDLSSAMFARNKTNELTFGLYSAFLASIAILRSSSLHPKLTVDTTFYKEGLITVLGAA